VIEEACLAIEQISAQERSAREQKYARRRKMNYIDGLLNELEMLNLADRVALPEPLEGAVGKLLEDIPERRSAQTPKVETVVGAMDVLYEVQDALMVNHSDRD
jgi:hypothetical protein